MLRLASVFSHIHKALSGNDPRFIIENDEHVVDTATGVTYHIYNNWFKITYNDEVVATKDDFTPEEQQILWEVKKLITDPVVLKQKEENFIPFMKARREQLSMLYENPTPVNARVPLEEEGATEYTG